MADGAANDIAANDVVELEALGKDGLSWHPCQVSLCPRGLGLIVLYGNTKLEEMITDKKEIFARIRVRSTPLQGDDCLSIREGGHVLATQNSHINGVFYDARVEQAIHVRHSKRSHCRCSFTIKWIHRPLPEEALTVPASAIMKLETKSIHLHPTISAFFSMQEPLDAMPCSIVADGKNWEMDINVFLEQQIKAISTSTDIPQENNLKDSVSGYKVDLLGQSHGCEIEVSLKDSLGAIPFLDRLKETKGSENKLPIEVILETPLAPTPSIREELIGSRLLLNPLASRAALASLRSEFSQSPKVSARCNENGVMTGHHSTANLLQGSTFCSSSAVDGSLNAEDYSLKTSSTLEGESPNLRSVVKKLFPTSSSPHTVEKKTGEKKNNIGEHSAEMRLTRTKIKIGNGTHETSQMTNNSGTQVRLTDTHRVTRSRGRGAEKAEDDEYNAAVTDHELTEFTKLETFLQSTIVPQNYLSDNQRAVASPFNGQISTRRVTRSRVEGVEKIIVNKYNAASRDNVHSECLKPGTNTQATGAPKYGFAGSQKVVASPTDGDTCILFVEDEKGSLGEDGKVVDVDTQRVNLIQNAKKQNNPKRLTRSAASKDTENNNVQPKLKLRKSDLTESNEWSAEEGESKKILTRVKTTPKSSESSVGGDKGTGKSATLKKQETQFSPRLRFLPRTRSQTKE